jgi:hypothetical protein
VFEKALSETEDLANEPNDDDDDDINEDSDSAATEPSDEAAEDELQSGEGLQPTSRSKPRKSTTTKATSSNNNKNINSNKAARFAYPRPSTPTLQDAQVHVLLIFSPSLPCGVLKPTTFLSLCCFNTSLSSHSSLLPFL